MEAAPELNKLDPRYPKAKYRKLEAGENGDVKSPAYESIKMVDGTPTRVVEFHGYVSVAVKDAKEEKTLGPEWADHPALLK